MKNFLLKLWWCKLWSWHKWTSPASRGEMPSLSDDATNLECITAICNYSMMTCVRCGHESEVAKEFRDEMLEKYKDS